MPDPGYWTRKMTSRRAALRGAALAGGGLIALSLVGCGGDDDDQAAGGGSPTTTSGVPKNNGNGLPTVPAADSLKGNPGGKLIMQTFGDPGGLVLVKTASAGVTQIASLTHSGLYSMASGHPGVDPTATSPELDLATAMPEQAPDQLTYTVKIRADAKFHNGRPVTADDVKYTWDRYALSPDSAYKSNFTWFDKVETPDPKTVVFKTKVPYADMLGSLTARNDSLILCKEHEEGPDAVNKLLGSGAFLFVERQAPVQIRYRRNPDYYNKPWPYFDEVTLLGNSDSAKRVADFTSKQTHVTYWFGEEQRDQIKRDRPDAILWGHQYSSHHIFLRVDQPPFTDKRVRQALSMAMDRKTIRDGTSKGDGELDGVFSWIIKTWGFRKPQDIAATAKYFNFDVQASKQLISAAGISAPFETQLIHWDPTVIGQGLIDTATLIETQYKNAGIANVKDTTITFGQSSSTTSVGLFDGMYVGPGAGGGAAGPSPGNDMKNRFWSPPEGPKIPGPNSGHVNDPTLSALLEKQLGQFKLDERKQTFKAMEELMSEEMYRIPISTITNNWFSDPNLRNLQIPYFHTNGSVHYLKYWWFDKPS